MRGLSLGFAVRGGVLEKARRRNPLSVSMELKVRIWDEEVVFAQEGNCCLQLRNGALASSLSWRGRPRAVATLAILRGQIRFQGLRV